MRKNEMYRSEGTIYRILDIQQEDALVIDCKRMTMPKWVKIEEIPESGVCPENEIFPELGISTISEERLTAEQSKVAHERFTIIADILPHIGNKPMRNHLVAQAAENNNVSRRTVTNYLCQYLVHQSIAVLAPQVKNTERELTQDEKNIRWALNKFFYTHHKNSLKTAYTMMLKEKYRDGRGILLPNYPSFDQFRYFYRKHNKMQTYYISRNGLKNYQWNDRPLLGDGVQAFAPSIALEFVNFEWIR